MLGEAEAGDILPWIIEASELAACMVSATSSGSSSGASSGASRSKDEYHDASDADADTDLILHAHPLDTLLLRLWPTDHGRQLLLRQAWMERRVVFLVDDLDAVPDAVAEGEMARPLLRLLIEMVESGHRVIATATVATAEIARAETAATGRGHGRVRRHSSG